MSRRVLEIVEKLFEKAKSAALPFKANAVEDWGEGLMSLQRDHQNRIEASEKRIEALERKINE